MENKTTDNNDDLLNALINKIVDFENNTKKNFSEIKGSVKSDNLIDTLQTQRKEQSEYLKTLIDKHTNHIVGQFQAKIESQSNAVVGSINKNIQKSTSDLSEENTQLKNKLNTIEKQLDFSNGIRRYFPHLITCGVCFLFFSITILRMSNIIEKLEENMAYKIYYDNQRTAVSKANQKIDATTKPKKDFDSKKGK